MKIARKTFTLSAGSIEFKVSGDPLPETIDQAQTNNYITLTTSGTPTAGTFLAFFESAPDSGFHPVYDIDGMTTQITATSVGANATDGEVRRWYFKGNPYRIKVTATGVTGVTEVGVIVTQNP